MALTTNESQTGAAGTTGTPPSPVLVFGMGATGASLARYCARHGLAAEFFDSRERPPGVADILDALPDARLHTGATAMTLPADAQQIIISPGFDLESSIVAEGRSRGVPMVSDIDLFFSECNAPVVAVTGSNGKSTVTSMLATALAAAGFDAVAGGNLGVPALDLLSARADYYVLELSSFQLERSAALPAAVAVVLNITPDHLDRHGTMDNYAAAKNRIYAACAQAVINRDIGGYAAVPRPEVPTTVFGLGEPAPGEFGVRKTTRGECIVLGDELLLSIDELPLLGRHNLANALAAVALGAALGLDVHSIAQGLKRFRGLPHRMQIVKERRGRRWVNDSKATNVDAAVMSIASVSDPLVLIAGGDAKGGTFEPLAAALEGRDCHVVLLGQDADRIADALPASCARTRVDTMKAAVRSADALFDRGTVLLAPACSSLDMYPHFAARGDDFAAAVESLGV